MGKYNISPFIPSGTPSAVLSYHDQWLNQGVTSTSDVIFKDIHGTGNLLIDGNITVLGTSFISESSIVTYKSHILILNEGEIGNGVQLNEAGIEIDRGTLESVRIVFRESDETFRVGVISDEQAIATREDVPLDKGVMVWNANSSQLIARDTIEIPLTLTSSLSVGDISLLSDVYVSGETRFYSTNQFQYTPRIYTDPANILTISAPTSITLDVTTGIQIPDMKPIWFGNDQQVAIYTENNDLYIATGSTKKVRLSSTVDATDATTASLILGGGMVVGKNAIFAGTVDHLLGVNGNKIRVQALTATYPTVFSIESNPLSPMSELRVNGSDLSGYLSLNYSTNGKFQIQSTGAASTIAISAGGQTDQFVLNIDGSCTFMGDVELLTAPTLPQHAVSKDYVDNEFETFAWKSPVRMITSNLPSLLVLGAVVDGYTLVQNDRVLISNSSDPTLNGIWVVTSSNAVRADDFTGVQGNAAMRVLTDDSEWMLTGGLRTVGTDALTFVRVSGLGQVTAGDGLSKSNDTIYVVTDTSLEVYNDQLRVSSGALSTGLLGGSGAPVSVNSHLPHLVETGTLGYNSTWQGQIIGTQYGGTGNSTFGTTGLVYSDGSKLTTDASKLTWTGSNLVVDGGISVTGSISTAVIDARNNVTIVQNVNCASITVHSADVVQNGPYCLLYLTLEISPTSSYTKSSIVFALPNKVQTILNSLDVMSVGSCGYAVDGGGAFVNLENILVAGLNGSLNAITQFFANANSSVHKLQITLRYQQ